MIEHISDNTEQVVPLSRIIDKKVVEQFSRCLSETTIPTMGFISSAFEGCKKNYCCKI